jgi:predicted RNase H-like HicB family nuclease
MIDARRENRIDALVDSAIIERCPDTNLFVGHVPGVAGAHSQGTTLEELGRNLHAVLRLLDDAAADEEKEVPQFLLKPMDDKDGNSTR